MNHTKVLKVKSARIIVNLQHSTRTVYHTNRVLHLYYACRQIQYSCRCCHKCIKCIYLFVSVALCPTPPDINFGTVVVTGNSIGDTATYTCDSGYELIGDAVSTCAKLPNDTSMADFQPEEPFCHRESCMNTSEWPWLLSCVNHTRVGKQKVHGLLLIYSIQLRQFITPIESFPLYYACRQVQCSCRCCHKRIKCISLFVSNN